MYRKIIFMLIGIDDTMYTDNIIKAVEALDNWYYERNRFIKGLDCIDKEFIDKQFEWIKQWRNMYDN